MTKEELAALNKKRQKELESISEEYGSMTECAMGGAIGDLSIKEAKKVPVDKPVKNTVVTK